VSQFVTKKGFKTAVILFITLVALIILFYVLINYLGDNIIERLSDRDDETGSGRLDIWNSLIQRLSMQDFEFWIFGNGHLSTTKYSWENLTAHNDFLEVVYNYGIINLIIYVLFFISTIRYVIRAIRQKNKYAPALAAILTIFSVLSVVSIIILSHTCVLVLICIGTLVGWSEHERQKIEQS
jgi:O-antigen ligase